MLKKNYLQFGLTTVVLVALFIGLRSSNRIEQKTDCKEFIGTCCKKTSSTEQGEMIWQSLSSQFISFTSTSN